MLFKAAAKTLSTITADPRHLGAEVGFVAVLHTWGQNLHHHPHIHCLVPGGGLSLRGTRWVSCRRGFFLPPAGPSRLFRGVGPGNLQGPLWAGKLGLFCTTAPLSRRPLFSPRPAAIRPVAGGRPCK